MAGHHQEEGPSTSTAQLDTVRLSVNTDHVKWSDHVKYHVKSVCRTVGIKCRPYVSQLTGKGVVQSAPPENNTKDRKINGVHRLEDSNDLEILLLERQLR